MAKITSGERIDKVAEILAASFHEDPLYTYILHDLDEPKRKAYLPKLLRGVVAACVLNGGSVIEVEDWSACAVFMPPGQEARQCTHLVEANPYSHARQRLIIEYPAAVDQVIARVLTKEEIRTGYWYGVIMCTVAGSRQKGLASSLVSYVQDLTRADRRPMWIEAPSLKTAQLYLHLGFGIIVLAGKGVVGIDGLAKAGDEGITAWGMIYRPRHDEGSTRERPSRL
ncbi:hypothetical protein EKO27_g9191 [Xylaria grammica]|uniref:N-acetyltransferase domain-containing protein n=1 Tax=Xylaria grammica TaxID=363999 RepID=A0A439CUQ4_9PEZI|nr:hypothetical protein EKO27_g9191 [Xylaria grammica]